MTGKSKPNYRYQLRVLAGKLEADSMTSSERTGLAKLLRGLGEGLSVEEIFGEKSLPHRPPNMLIEQRIFDIAVLMCPKKHGGGGLTKAKAIDEVAKLYKVSYETVETDYKSSRGKKIRELVKASFINPLASEESI